MCHKWPHSQIREEHELKTAEGTTAWNSWAASAQICTNPWQIIILLTYFCREPPVAESKPLFHLQGVFGGRLSGYKEPGPSSGISSPRKIIRPLWLLAFRISSRLSFLYDFRRPLGELLHSKGFSLVQEAWWWFACQFPTSFIGDSKLSAWSMSKLRVLKTSQNLWLFDMNLGGPNSKNGIGLSLTPLLSEIRHSEWFKKLPHEAALFPKLDVIGQNSCHFWNQNTPTIPRNRSNF